MNERMSTIRLAALGTAIPSWSISQKDAAEFLLTRYGSRLRGPFASLLKKVFDHPSVGRRYFAIDDPAELIDEDPDRRMERFSRSATALACSAARQALERAGIGSRDIGGIVVNTCTGYLCPGLSGYVTEQMGFDRHIPAYDLVGAGCAGAIPNLKLCSMLATQDPSRPVIGIAVEICSATFQMGNDPSLILSNALFGDGAAAAVVGGSLPGPALAGFRSWLAPEHREDIRFVYRRGQLHNKLSKHLPEIVSRAGARLIEELLAETGQAADDIRFWAVHPGGSRILDAFAEVLPRGEVLNASRAVLADYGNMSSATILFILDRLLRDGYAPADTGMMVAFGAGFSAHACLLRAG